MILYLITNKVNGKRYVGITIRTMRQRWTNHCAFKSPKTALQRAISKYGRDCFTMEQIGQASDIEQLERMEREAIMSLGTWAADGNGYNETFGGIGFRGRHTAETRAKMSASRIGKSTHPGPHHKPNLGNKHTAETRAKISAANIGRVQSESEKANRRVSMALVERKPEWGALISAAKKGKPIRQLSEEERDRVYGPRRGVPLSAQVKAKISASMFALRASQRAAKTTNMEAV